MTNCIYYFLIPKIKDWRKQTDLQEMTTRNCEGGQTMFGLTRVHALPTLPEWPRSVDCIAQIPRVEPNMTKKKIVYEF